MNLPTRLAQALAFDEKHGFRYDISPIANGKIEHDRLAPLHRAVEKCVEALDRVAYYKGKRRSLVPGHVFEALASLNAAIKESGK